MITKLVDMFISTIKDFDRSMFSLSGGLGPWLAPIAPALVYGHTFYAGTRDELGDWSIVGGVAMAAGLVVAGATSSHTAIALKSAGAPVDKVRACWALVVAYIVLEIGGILTMNNFDSIEVVGVTASLLTLVVYLSRSYKNYLDEFKAQAAETKAEKQSDKDMMIEYRLEQARLDAEAKRDAERERLRLEHEEKMAKIEAKKERDIVKLSVKSDVKPASSDLTSDSPEERQKAILDAILSKPDVKRNELALQFGVSRQTIYNDLKSLKDQGVLNGGH